MMRKTFIIAALGAAIAANAAEVLRPILPPGTWASVEGAVELDDDIYSGDMNVSAEYALPMAGGMASLYVDGAFRFLSYSYEYSSKGYIHNYCNLHVNGFNETYVGTKVMPFSQGPLLRGLGLNLGWRFPPGEGSRQNRFHRLNVEPFYTYSLSSKLTLGTAFRYNRFFERDEFAPGDEIGLKASLAYKFFWNVNASNGAESGWLLDEVFLYQKRIQESENLHMERPYRKMDDTFQGMKFRFDLSRVFGFAKVPTSLGLRYEFHEGSLFGFEAGHTLGIFAKVGL